MKALFWYKIVGLCVIAALIIYGGYRGFIAFQIYEANQINAAVQLKTNQLEQQFSSQTLSGVNATTSASTTIDTRVNQLEAQIQKLQTPSIKGVTSADTAQIATLQKQVTAIKNASSGPVVTFVNPTIMIAGYTNTVSINGTGFEAGIKVKLGSAGLQINGTPTPNLISAEYPSGFNPGVYDVTVTNPNGDTFTYPSAISIRPGAPSTPTDNILSTTQIVSKVSPSVVLIRANFGNTRGCGSGMIVDSNGLILTDDHVVNGSNNVTVYLGDGEVFPATIQQENPSEDLAVLRISKNGLPAVTFDDSSNPNLPLGASVISLGYPSTCLTDQNLAVEAGIITARRTVPSFSNLGELLQTSALINPGASGGPLVNQTGNVVGLNELAVLVDTTYELNISGISYATQSNVAKAFLNNLPLQNSQSGISQTQSLQSNSATLSVVVNVNNAAGGTATPSNFTITIIGGNPSKSSFPGSTSGNQITIDANKFYGVNISTLPNYEVSNNGSCANAGGISVGITVNCSFTESFVPSSN